MDFSIKTLKAVIKKEKRSEIEREKKSRRKGKRKGKMRSRWGHIGELKGE